MSIALNHLDRQQIAVFGLARSGLATVRAALAGGAQAVFAWDDKQESRDKAAALGATLKEPENWPWADIELLVLAPGVPLTHPQPHPVVGLARQAGVEIVCDIELLFRQVDGKARFIAITGTNGKSTTTALIGHILLSDGMSAEIGGNIGVAALDLDGGGADPVFVLELSSYQLDLVSRFRPDIAIWLNLTPDHLDRHGDIAGYRKAKARLFDSMTPDDLAIIGIDEAEMEDVAAGLESRQAPPQISTVSVKRHMQADYCVDADGNLSDQSGKTLDLTQFGSLRGAHNWQNAACAVVAARAIGLADAAIVAAMNSFPGLAHRMEIVGQRGRVLFVNDSKATNADAAARALSTFMPIYWIAGGRPKQDGIAGLQSYFPRIAKAYLVGEAAAEFSAALAGQVPHVIAGDIGNAVTMAAADAICDDSPEPVVLLSPACASFDQFADFESRGQAFKAAFHSIDQTSPNEEAMT